MSEQNKMDEFFRQSFGDYTPDVPPHIWENIAAERRKRKPTVFWFNKKTWLLLAALLMVAGGTSLWLLNNPGKPADHTLSTSTTENKPIGATDKPGIVNNPAAGTNNNTGKTNGEEIASDGIKPDNTNINDQPIGVTSAVEPTAQPISKATTVSANSNGKATAVVNTSHKNSNVKRKQHVPVRNNDVVIIDNINNLPRADKNAKNSKSDLVRSNITFRNNNAESFKQGRVRATVAAGQEGEDDNANAETAEKGVVPAVGLMEKNLPLLPFAVKQNNTTELKPVKIPDCPTAGKERGDQHFYIEAYAGPDYAVKKYSDTLNSILVQKRKESISFQSAYSAGIRFTKVFSNGLSIRAGINYSQINEKFSFLKDNVVQIVYVISPQGDTTDSYYVRGTRYRNTANHYRSVDIPVVLGYELGSGNLHANINAGVVVNIRSWQSGSTIDQNLMPVNLNAANTVYQYKSNLGLGFTGAVSLYYRLNDRYQLLFEPYYRHNFSPINKEAASIQERFTTMGLRLGLRIDLR